ncbi:MAG: hypothetical protein ACMXYE_00810 [Candidatus Woesearchaeota archaeon]
MKEKVTSLFIAFLLVAIASIGMASAYRGDADIKEPEYSEERCSVMKEVFATQDYATWKSVMESSERSPRVLQVVNEENFAVFAQAHEAKVAGNHDLAQQLRAELGLNNGNGPKDRNGFGKMSGNGNNGQHNKQANMQQKQLQKKIGMNR